MKNNRCKKKISMKVFVFIAVAAVMAVVSGGFVYSLAGDGAQKEIKENNPDNALEIFVTGMLSSLKGDELEIQAEINDNGNINGTLVLMYDECNTLPKVSVRADNRYIYLSADEIAENELCIDYYSYTEKCLKDYFNKKPGSYRKVYNIEEYSDVIEQLGVVAAPYFEEIIGSIAFTRRSDLDVNGDDGENADKYAYELSISADKLNDIVYRFIDECYADRIISVELSLLAGVYKYKKEDLKNDYALIMSGAQGFGIIMYTNEKNEFVGFDAASLTVKGAVNGLD